MDRNFEENRPLAAPGLAVGGGSKYTFKYGNSVSCKANGIVSTVTTTADAPALTTAKNKSGTTPTTLAIDYCRVYTLLSAVNADTGAQTFTLVVGEDFPETRPMKMSDINFGNSADNDAKKAVVGWIYIFNTTNVFTPGSTALDASGVTTRYFDNYGFIGF